MLRAPCSAHSSTVQNKIRGNFRCIRSFLDTPACWLVLVFVRVVERWRPHGGSTSRLQNISIKPRSKTDGSTGIQEVPQVCPAKKRIKLLKVEARQPLQILTWKLEALTVIVHKEVQTVWESDSNSPRRPRKLKITIFWRIFGVQICTTAPQVVVPGRGENWCRQFWRHEETIDFSFTWY